MTLNILFFTISIKKRSRTLEESVEQERVERLYEENKDKRITQHHIL